MADLRNLAQNGKWELSYDEDNDSLYYAPARIPKGTALFNFGSEFGIYIDGESNINGLFIEYFTSNFTEHEHEYKKIVELLDNNVDGYKTSNNKDSDDVKIAENALSGEALKSFYVFFEKIEEDSVKKPKENENKV